MAAVREGRTRFVTPRFEKTFFDWMKDIHDWNVSRQLWWGHRIPAWYCPDGHVTVSDLPSGPASCAECTAGATELRQDEDIFDTWFSSGLWPFSTLGWPDADRRPRALLPGHGHGDRLRHHLLLGRPDDDARRVADGPRAVLRSSTSTAWSATPTAPRCPRPAATWSTRWASSTRWAPTRSASRSSTALAAGHGPEAVAQPARGRPQLRQQDLERRPIRARAAARGAARRRRARAPLTRACWGPPSTGSSIAATPPCAAVDAGLRHVPVRRGRPPAARGHLGRVLRLVPGARQDPARGRTSRSTAGSRPGRCWRGSSTGICACSTRSCPTSRSTSGRGLPEDARRPGPAHRGALARQARRGVWTPSLRPARRELLELITAIRNARTDAGIDAGDLAGRDHRAPHRRAARGARGSRGRRGAPRARPGEPSPTIARCWMQLPDAIAVVTDAGGGTPRAHRGRPRPRPGARRPGAGRGTAAPRGGASPPRRPAISRAVRPRRGGGGTTTGAGAGRARRAPDGPHGRTRVTLAPRTIGTCPYRTTDAVPCPTAAGPSPTEGGARVSLDS